MYPSSSVLRKLLKQTKQSQLSVQFGLFQVFGYRISLLYTNQKMDSHFYAEEFSSLQLPHVCWNFSTVRVEFVWEDVKQQKLFIILLDQNRDKMVAIVPSSLLDFYRQRNLLGGVFSLEHFQIEGTCHDYVRYEKYSFVRGDWVILIGRNTLLNPLTEDIERRFAFYPSVPSIRTLVEDRTTRKMMIDVVGKIVKGRRVRYDRDGGIYRLGSCDLFLQDGTGHIIKLRLYDMFPFKLKRKQFPIRLCFAMTINKAQGQTIPVVGVYLPESVFSHGQLYVVLSRGISRDTTKVLVKPTKKFKHDGVYTSNMVYREVLSDDCI